MIQIAERAAAAIDRWNRRQPNLKTLFTSSNLVDPPGSFHKAPHLRVLFPRTRPSRQQFAVRLLPDAQRTRQSKRDLQLESTDLRRTAQRAVLEAWELKRPIATCAARALQVATTTWMSRSIGAALSVALHMWADTQHATRRADATRYATVTNSNSVYSRTTRPRHFSRLAVVRLRDRRIAAFRRTCRRSRCTRVVAAS